MDYLKQKLDSTITCLVHQTCVSLRKGSKEPSQVEILVAISDGLEEAYRQVKNELFEEKTSEIIKEELERL